MNVTRYFAAKRAIHQRFQSSQNQRHHAKCSSLILNDLNSIERHHQLSLQKEITSAYSLYLDELVEAGEHRKIFLHNYYQSIRTISGADHQFCNAMKDSFGIDSEFGRLSNDFFFAQQVNEQLRIEFMTRVQSWSAKERLACLEEIHLAKAMMNDVVREYE